MPPRATAGGAVATIDSAKARSLGIHVQAGGAFTSDNLLFPGTGEPWFGGSLGAGYALLETLNGGQIQVSGQFTWAQANPAALADDSPKFAQIDARISYQVSHPFTEGVGARANLGLQRILAGTSFIESKTFLPLASLSIIAQRPSGLYFYLEYGYMPVVLGLGMNL